MVKPSVEAKRIPMTFPWWFRIFVCLGAMFASGLVGLLYGTAGLILGIFDGLLVGVLWLHWMTQNDEDRFSAGMLWGILAGTISTVLVHAPFGIRGGFDGLVAILSIGLIFGIITGGVFGVICVLVLQIDRGIRRWKETG